MSASVWAPGTSIDAADTVKYQTYAAVADQLVYEITNFSYVPNVGSLFVYVGGVFQEPGVAYTETDSTHFTFVTAPPAGVSIVVMGFTGITTTVQAEALAQALAASTGTNLVGYGTRTLAQKLSDIAVSVKDFGAVGDGITDDTAAIQAAIDSLTAGGSCFFPRGTYLISDTITLGYVGEGIRLHGVALHGTVILQSNASAKIFEVSDINVTIEKFRLTYVDQGLTGATAVDFVLGDNTLRDVVIQGADIGVEISGGNCEVSRVSMNDLTTCGILVANAITAVIQSVNIYNSDTAYCTLGGIRLFNTCAYITVIGVTIYGGTYGITVDAAVPGPTSSPRYNSFHGVACYGSLNGSSILNCYELNFNSCWFSTNSSNGVYLENVNGVKFIGGGAIGNSLRGVLLESGLNVLFDGFSARANSVESAGVYSGIVVAANVNKFTVTNCVLGEDYELDYGRQKHGLEILAGTSNNYTVTGNTVTGNNDIGISDGGTGDTKYIANNVGYINSVKFQTVMNIANFVATVPHYLDVTPNITDFVVLPVGNVANSGVTRWWVDNITSTDFRITVDTAVSGVDLFFTVSINCSGAYYA